MSFGVFLLGVLLATAGFFMVWKTFWFERNFGDIGAAFGLYGSTWMSWKLIGLVLILLGFMIAFGLFELFFRVTFGQLFNLGGF